MLNHSPSLVDLRPHRSRYAGFVVAVAMTMSLAGAIHAETSTAFFAGDYPAALKAAQKSQKNVLVEVFATWCGPCKKQAKEVFDTATGALLTRDVVAIRIDFDAEPNQSFVKTFNVLSLPTVLVVRPDGSEIGRIEGYEKKKEFVAAIEPLLAGTDELATLEKKWRKANPKSKRAAELQVSVGHALLVRGDTARGLGLLETASTVRNHSAPAQDALFLLGRYYSRVTEDHAQARHIWRELYVRFPKGEYKLTALWWYTGDLVALGRSAQAGSFLAAAIAASPKDKEVADIAVSAIEKYGAMHDVVGAALAQSRLSKKDKAAFAARISAAPKKTPAAKSADGTRR